MAKESKINIQTWSAIFMLALGAGLAIAGFVVSPMGEISESVLWIFAQCLIYAGSALGINAFVQSKFIDIKNEMRRQQEALRKSE